MYLNCDLKHFNQFPIYGNRFIFILKLKNHFLLGSPSWTARNRCPCIYHCLFCLHARYIKLQVTCSISQKICFYKLPMMWSCLYHWLKWFMNNWACICIITKYKNELPATLCVKVHAFSNSLFSFVTSQMELCHANVFSNKNVNIDTTATSTLVMNKHIN